MTPEQTHRFLSIEKVGEERGEKEERVRGGGGGGGGLRNQSFFDPRESLVARLKLSDIDGRAPPGVEPAA